MTHRALPVSTLLLALGFTGIAIADDVIDARRIYDETCSVCHGDDGGGAVWGQTSLSVPPRNFRSEQSRRQLSRERMIASVTYGRPNTPMPGFGTQLSPAEIAAVVDMIRAEFMTGDTAAGSASDFQHPGNAHYGPVGPAAAKPELPADYAGDAARGALLFAQNCVACHGADGRGDGPRAYFIFPKPRNFHDPASRAYLDRRKLYSGIKFGVVGKEMPAWGKVMSDAQIADVTEYVYRQFIDSGSGD